MERTAPRLVHRRRVCEGGKISTQVGARRVSPPSSASLRAPWRATGPRRRAQQLAAAALAPFRGSARRAGCGLWPGGTRTASRGPGWSPGPPSSSRCLLRSGRATRTRTHCSSWHEGLQPTHQPNQRWHARILTFFLYLGFYPKTSFSLMRCDGGRDPSARAKIRSSTFIYMSVRKP